MVSINVKSRSKSLQGLVTDELTVESSIGELVDLISGQNKTASNRLRITRLGSGGKQEPLESDKKLSEYGYAEIEETVELFVKDLGPQLSWRAVYLVEYFGPLVIHPLIYFCSKHVNGQAHTETQKIAFVLVMLHFLKRELETSFVHKFSNATMPAFNIFKNSSHYWILSGFNLSYFIYSSELTGWKRLVFHVNKLPSYANYAIVAIWAFAELSNLKTHLTLSSLRSSGKAKGYVIPYGYGFTHLACPNYTFEALSWLAYAILVGNWAAWVFFVVGTGQMWLWAVKRHRRYLNLFGDEYKKLRRNIFVPFVV